MQFFIPLKKPITCTHQQKKVAVVKGKPRFYEDDRLKNARASLLAHLGQHRPDAPFDPPIRVVIKWIFKGKQEWCTKEADLDNLAKLTLDCMTKLVFWKDDMEISSLVLEKMYDEIPGMWIHIEEL